MDGGVVLTDNDGGTTTTIKAADVIDSRLY